MSMQRLTQSIRQLLQGRSKQKARRQNRARLNLLTLEERTVPSLATGHFQGIAFVDSNNNFVRELNEPALRGATIVLAGRTDFNQRVVQTVRTGPGGGYRFNHVTQGNYRLFAFPTSGYLPNGANQRQLIFQGRLEGGDRIVRRIAYQGLIPPNVSLSQFLNTTTTNSFQTQPAGTGRQAVNPRPNHRPELIGPVPTMIVGKNAGPMLLDVFTDKDMNSRVRIETNLGNIVVELFDQQTPRTVANFLSYVQSNRYDSTIFHRLGSFLHGDSEVRDVLQGGLFRFSPGALTQILTNAAIADEVKIPNVAGTIAMAKTSAANSATSQFFFNLIDNTNPLSPKNQANGGFTPFGRIDSMSRGILEAMAAFNVQNQSSFNGALTDLPLKSTANTQNFPVGTVADDYILIKDVVIERRATANTDSLTYKVLNNTNPSLVIPKIGSDGQLRLEFANNSTGAATLTIRATDQLGAFSTTQVTIEVVNDPPIASVTLTPSAPLTNDTMTATVNTFDPNGDAVLLTYVWKLNGEEIKRTENTSSTTDTLNLSLPGNGGKGDLITVEVTPTDGLLTGQTVTASRTIADTAPSITNLSFNPEAPRTNDVLTVTATAVDPDGDEISYTYVWRVNNVVVKTTSNTLSVTDTLDLSIAGNGNAFDTITVEVTPTAAGLVGTVQTKSLIVANTPPEIQSFVVTPNNPGTNDVLTASAQVIDADGSTPFLTFIWKVNGEIVQTSPTTTNTTNTFDLSLPGHGVRGDQIVVELIASDGTDTAQAVSSPIIIVDSPPVVSSLTFGPETPGVSDALTASVLASDPDGDDVFLTFVWKHNGSVVQTTTETADPFDVLDLALLAGVAPGDLIEVEVTPVANGLTGSSIQGQVNVA